jgi:hypothetical protein
MALKTLRKKASGVKRMRLERFDPLENLKPLYDEEGSFFADFWIEFRWPLARASVKFGKCICCSIYACFAFCLFVSSFLGDNSNNLNLQLKPIQISPLKSMSQPIAIVNRHPLVHHHPLDAHYYLVLDELLGVWFNLDVVHK